MSWLESWLYGRENTAAQFCLVPGLSTGLQGLDHHVIHGQEHEGTEESKYDRDTCITAAGTVQYDFMTSGS